MIPEEAVEAAAELIYRTSGRRRVMSYEKAREACESEARELLEAAAPHMLAAAWDEGRKHGATYPYGERGLATDDNPYRTAK